MSRMSRVFVVAIVISLCSLSVSSGFAQKGSTTVYSATATFEPGTPDTTLRDGYRHFIMPTARPITGGYVGVWELAFLQAGVGFGDVLSLSGGFTVMPTVSFKSQFAFLQAKLTAVEEGPFSFAAGLNLLRLTSDHLYTHLFAVGTYELPSRVRFSGLFFYKLSGDDFPIINVRPYGQFAFNYGGPIGVGVGFDAPIPQVDNLHVVAEAWNHDISSPTKLAALIALRVENPSFSSDFGFMYFTQPLLVPVANFVWRF
jgi:hypothetical protein